MKVKIGSKMATVNDPILFFKGKNYIPRNMDLRQEIVKSFHDHETQAKLGHTMQYNKTIGGQDSEHL